MKITVSIVTYRSNAEQFFETLQSLEKAIEYAKLQIEGLYCDLIVIENDTEGHSNQLQLESFLEVNSLLSIDRVEIKSPGSNLGYGGGHNLALGDLECDYHLVLNPDVFLAPEAIFQGLSYLADNPGSTLVSPRGVDAQGGYIYLCKRYPQVFILFLRGFAPVWLKAYFQRQLADYEMHSLSTQLVPVSDIEIVSGCCMLMRSEAFRKIGGFDTRFFLYFEDFDLSLRMAKVGTLTYLPAMEIVHHGGHAASKGFRHLGLFVASGLKFYQRYGWRWY